MASRNQKRPPRSPPNTIPLARRRQVGAEWVGRQGTTGRSRQPLALVNKGPGVNKADDVASAEGSECGFVEFTKEDVEALLTEKMKTGNPFDNKGKIDQMGKLIRRLKLCVKYFEKREESNNEEKEKLQSALESAEKKCTDTETEMKKKNEELSDTISDLRQTISSLEERIVKEESLKLEAIDFLRVEKEARSAAEEMQVLLSTKLEKVEEEKLAEELKAKQTLDYNINLQDYNKDIHSQLESTNRVIKDLESHKAALIATLSDVRGLNKALQVRLETARVSEEKATKLNDVLIHKLDDLRVELKQLKNDRDEQHAQVHALTGEVASYKELIGNSCAELDVLRSEIHTLESARSSQKEQIDILQQQLMAEKEKVKMADLTRTSVKEKEFIIGELQARLADKEFLITEGEKLRKKLHNSILELKGNIRVFCRVRPLLPDHGVGMNTMVSYPTSAEGLDQGIELVQSGKRYSFTFDKVFNPEASQQDVFIEISQLVQSALDGYKVCIFAYGQTGSGKTYTMMGRPNVPDLKGLIPRSLEQIFQISEALKDQGWTYKLKASMLEIYNDAIHDLLASNRASRADLTRTETGVLEKQYNIQHDASGNTEVSDLTVVDVCSVDEISLLLQQATNCRSVGRTQVNEQSSRSHFVFTLRLSGVNENTEQQVQGVLNLIDLAGSERLSRSGATGDRLKETQAINKSLSSLSDVIFALAKKEEHVPFRNSKLTYLLQPCLAGDSKTLMFVNVSPDPSSAGETLCSLRFASKVKACEIGVPARQITPSLNFRKS
ncbi:kinesin-like protein KIN-14C isoform X2 [Prosopis cineraria]|uniref:kinesin-like protein KIN-14C isoform X2 n=1 Tax=Prosopis cineraria TaxID=364024 RepID=UPI0024104F92|nr:kinesin-like protein KIN-14C isoform X2 [Prosopis cineraria]